MTRPPRGSGTCWIFDLDGTVVDSERRFLLAYNDTLGPAGHDCVTLEEFRHRSRHGRLLLDLDLPGADGALLWDEVMQRFVDGRGLSTVLPRAREALDLLRSEGTRAALVTGRVDSVALLEDELRALGLDGVFALVATATTVRLVEGRRQTKAELFAQVTASLRVAAESSVYVTDWPFDLLDAHAHGFGWCVGVETGGFHRDDFPDLPRVHTAASVAELVFG